MDEQERQSTGVKCLAALDVPHHEIHVLLLRMRGPCNLDRHTRAESFLEHGVHPRTRKHDSRAEQVLLGVRESPSGALAPCPQGGVRRLNEACDGVVCTG